MSLSQRNESQSINGALMEKVIAEGDLSKLTASERVMYYTKTCESMSLNPLTRPFEYIKLNGRLVMYARKDCTDQLRNNNRISIVSLESKVVEGVYIVTARARKPDGHEDVSTGAVTITGLKGDALANAFLKAETKAKRRVTLSLCGLGFTDESEVESIPNAVPITATLAVVEPDKTESLKASFDNSISEIKYAESIDELKKAFDSVKSIDWSGTEYMKELIEAKDRKKLELEHGEWVDRYESGEKNEVTK